MILRMLKAGLIAVPTMYNTGVHTPAYASNSYSSDTKELENLSDAENALHLQTEMAIESTKILLRLCTTDSCRDFWNASIEGMERAQQERIDKNEALGD